MVADAGRCMCTNWIDTTALLDKMPRDSGIPDPATMAEWSPGWDTPPVAVIIGAPRQEFKTEPAVPTVPWIFVEILVQTPPLFSLLLSLSSPPFLSQPREICARLIENRLGD